MQKFIGTVNTGLNTLRDDAARWMKHIPEWAAKKIDARKSASPVRANSNKSSPISYLCANGTTARTG